MSKNQFLIKLDSKWSRNRAKEFELKIFRFRATKVQVVKDSNSRDRKYRLDAISFEYVNVKYPILSTASPYEDSGWLEWPID